MAHFHGYDGLAKLSLEHFPVHVLYVIFRHLDLRSLLTLSAVSKTFNKLIANDYLNNKSYSLLVTNQYSPQIKKKSLQILSGIHKFRNNFHWQKKQYNDFVFLKSVERFRPWLQLRSKDLFVSQGAEVLLFKRNKNGIAEKPHCIFKGHREDVVRFVVKDNVMISGGNDGKICYWKTDRRKPLFSVSSPIRWNENLYIHSSQNIVAAGFSFLGEIHFWSVKEDAFEFCRRTEINETLRSISLSEDATHCALGSCGYKAPPLKILDLNREHYINLSGEFKVGAGIYDIIWETPHILLTGGFDTMLHVWDTRLGRYVQSWTDPYDAAIYTLATDYNCTIMTGSASYSRVTLWDKRHPSCIQAYFISKKKFAGPVYSFDFDPTYMFVALDTSLHILDFSNQL